MEERTIIAPDMPPAPAPGGNVTQVLSPGQLPPGIAPVYGGDATQQAITVMCPVCQTPNGPAERYCQDCGFLLGSAPAELEPLPDSSQLPRLMDATGREFSLNPGVNLVGRESADVWIADPTISRRHAQLTMEGGQLVVEDLGSTNGTYVASRPVPRGERATAFDGDSVKFGSVTLTLSLPGGQSRPAGGTAEPPAGVAAPAAPPVDRGAEVAVLAMGDGTEFPLFEGTNTLGRRSGNQIVLPDAFASGKHAEITCQGGTATLVDLGSTNGTFIAGQRLAANVPTPLSEGTVVTFGKTALTFRPAQSASADATLLGESPAAEPAAVGEPLTAWDDATMLPDASPATHPNDQAPA